jgi:PAS domain S-box-containing protein
VAADGTGRHVYGNAAFRRLLGIEPASIRGRRPPFPYWASESADELEKHLRAELNGELNKPGHAPLRAVFRRKDGERVPVSLTCDMIRDRAGSVKLHVALIRADHSQQCDFLSQADPLVARVRFLENLVQRIGRHAAEAGVGIPLVTECPEADADTLDEISPRQWEILEQVLEGQRVATIGQRLRISPHTVRAHLKSIFRKIGVSSQAELIDKLHPPH